MKNRFCERIKMGVFRAPMLSERVKCWGTLNVWREVGGGAGVKSGVDRAMPKAPLCQNGGADFR